MTQYHREIHTGSAIALIARGPVLAVEVSQRRAILDERSAGAVSTRMIEMLIDTGASHSVIDSEVLRSLGVFPISMTHVRFALGETTICPVFRVDLLLRLHRPDGATASFVYPTQVIGRPAPGGLRPGLLGRDFLSRTRMVYEGDSGRVSLSLPAPGP